MPTVVYQHPDGTRTALDVRAGTTVMQAAVDHNIKGIIGECGGSAMCATCHVYVDEAQLGSLPARDAIEEEMLASTASPRLPNSLTITKIPAMWGPLTRASLASVLAWWARRPAAM